MSKERELLKELITRDMVEYYYPTLVKKVEELLAQPERGPLSDEEITKAFMQSDFGTWDSKSYRSGFRDAEKAHGIGEDDEHC